MVHPAYCGAESALLVHQEHLSRGLRVRTAVHAVLVRGHELGHVDGVVEEELVGGAPGSRVTPQALADLLGQVERRPCEPLGGRLVDPFE